MPGGSQVKVNDNKNDYLNKLAQYRFVRRNTTFPGRVKYVSNYKRYLTFCALTLQDLMI